MDTSDDVDMRDLIDGAVLLAGTANAVMQLARPAVGYGVLESKIDSGQTMRCPFRRIRNTVTYMSVAMMGTEEEQAYYRRQANRAHALVRSAPGSPVRYNAFDPRLQLWVAACLYRGGMDVRTRLHGPVDEATADAIYRQCRRFGTTLQVPEHMWPADRAAFEQYWAAALAELRIDPPVRDYLNRLIGLEYLPRPFGAALGPVNRFLTTGFLPRRSASRCSCPGPNATSASSTSSSSCSRRSTVSCRHWSRGSRSTSACTNCDCG